MENAVITALVKWNGKSLETYAGELGQEHLECPRFAHYLLRILSTSERDELTWFQLM